MKFKPGFLIVITLFLTASGCSTPKFFYTKIDWFLPYYIEKYVSLTDDQDQIIDSHLRELVSWHCDTQLEQYSMFFREIAADVKNNDVTLTKISDVNDNIKLYWQQLVDKSTPFIVDVLYRLNAKQTNELFENLTEHYQEDREDLLGVTPEKAQEEALEHLLESFEQWIGDIEDGQRQLISIWSKRYLERKMAKLNVRLLWQEKLQVAMKNKENFDYFNKTVSNLLQNPQLLWDQTYKTMMENNRLSLYVLIKKIYSTMTTEQRQFLSKRLDRWITDIDDLQCKASTVKVSLYPKRFRFRV